MSNMLKAGDTVQTISGGVVCQVEDLLGSGGQGEVYRLRMGQEKVALKWYLPSQGTLEQRTNLETLVRKGPPSHEFLWPMDLVFADEKASFGYIMPLREIRFKSMVDLMLRRVDPSLRALAIAGTKLSHAFLQLHAQGLCYRDISLGNVFFDPKTGDISVCDNDNVSVDDQKVSGVAGTPRFMAPEIVRGEARPSTQTDLFSLAVFLFYMLIRHHPLEGQKEAAIHCFDLFAMRKLYGEEPVFIFDPTNPSNRPVEGAHTNALALWPLYPKFLQDLFTRAFTLGLQQPGQRVRESEWRQALARLADCIFYCSICGRENLCEPTVTQPPPTCWNCHQTVHLPTWLEIAQEGGPKVAMFLNHDTKLYPHHLDRRRRFDFSKPVAEIIRHPQNPQQWGLKNLSERKWEWQSPAGKRQDAEPSKAIPIILGGRIQFGAAEGKFCDASLPPAPAEPANQSHG